MLIYLPTELVYDIAELCQPQEQARLSRTCSRFHSICNAVLYKDNVRNCGASSVFYAIAKCVDPTAAMGILRSAHSAGFDFQHCRDGEDRIDAPLTYSPLHLAAVRGREAMVSFLLDCGVSPDGPDSCETPPLFAALLAGEEAVALLLAQRGASLQSQKLGLNALHASIDASLTNMAVYLVLDAGVDVNARAQSGATPIMLAISSGRISVACLLVRLGARIYDALLHVCYQQEFHTALKLLDAATGVSIWPPLSSKETQGITALVLENAPTSVTREILRDALLAMIMQMGSH